jgi:hypothetical protein
MGRYDRIWTGVAGTAAAVALTAAFHGCALVALGCLFISAGGTGALLTLACLPAEGRWTAPLTKAFVASGVASWMLMGAGHLAGYVGVAALVAVAAAAPGVLHFVVSLRRLSGRRAVLSSLKSLVTSLDAPSTPRSSTSSSPASASTSSSPTATVREEPVIDPRTMSDHDLCQAWRSTYRQLQRAAAPETLLRIATLRARYLEELERRAGPAGQDWLAHAKRAAGEADGLLARGRRRRPRGTVTD